jgi:RimJ/RimL family protein N-acetyltransferase
MLEYGFTVLSLHSAFLRHFAYNARGHRAYLRAGFREIGRRRECAFWAGKPYDLVYMDCLASEFEGSALKHLRETDLTP